METIIYIIVPVPSAQYGEHRICNPAVYGSILGQGDNGKSRGHLVVFEKKFG